MVKFPSIFHGAHLEKTDQAATELSYSYLGQARIFITRAAANLWSIQANLNVVSDHVFRPPSLVHLQAPPVPESQVLDTFELAYKWLRSTLEDDVKLAEQLLQEDLDADREANSRLEEFKKGHPPTLWERLG